jgi:predicted nucleic acid-binding protein
VSEDKRKRDVELILRFFALHYTLKAYQKPMKGFLNEFMRKNRKPPTEQLTEFETLFKRTADAVLDQLGPKPFHIRAGLNAAVYDSTFVAFAKHLARIDRRGSLGLRSKFNSLIKNKNYVKYVSSATTDADVVPKRIALANRILFG